MKLSNLYISFFVIVGSIFIHACQEEVVYEKRPVRTVQNSDNAATPISDDAENAGDDEAAPEEDAEATVFGDFSMSWDNAADPAVISYKVFVLPPDTGTSTYKNLSGIPIEVKNFPIADLTVDGAKYSVTVTSAEIEEAIGATVVDPETVCFSLVSVNAVGNSIHSAKVCP